MPSDANITTRSTGRPSRFAVAVPAVTVKVIAAAPTKAGASQRIQRLIGGAPLPGLEACEANLSRLAVGGNGIPPLGTDKAHALVHLLERGGRRFAGLLGAAPEQPLELGRIGAKLLI